MQAPLLDREREIAGINDALTRAAAGSGTVIVIEGEAGIGKSTLVRCARESAAEQGFVVLAARGTELETDFAFGVIRRCLEPALRDRNRVGPDPKALFSGAACLAEPVLTGAPRQDIDLSFGVFHGLYWLLVNLCEHQPILLAVDDAHWADDASVRFLAYLEARIESLPVALLVATRPIDQDQPDAGVLTALLSDPATAVLTPGALSEQAVVQLLGGSVDRGFARACRHAAGGNPFLLTELVRALDEDAVPFTAESVARIGAVAPPQVARSVQARLGRLEANARALARAIATLGDDIAPDLAAELAGLATPEAESAAAALTRAGLLEGARVLRFRHPLLRAAVASAIPPLEAERGHRAAAALLRERGAGAEEVALHLVHARPSGDPADVATLRAAAERATARGAPTAAVPPLRRALEEPLSVAERVEVLMALADAERRFAQSGAAVEHLHEAVRAAPDAVLRARALVALTRAIGPAEERVAALVPSLEAALDESEALDPELRLRLQAAFVSAAGLAGPEHQRRAADIAAELATLPGDTAGEAIALSALLVRPERTTDARTLGSLAERAARNAGELFAAGAMDGRAHSLLVALRWTDRLEVAGRLTEQWIDIARRQGSPTSFAAASGNRSNLNRTAGRLQQAEADAAAAIAAAPIGELSWMMAHVSLADCLLKRGDVAAAGDAYDAAGFPEQLPLSAPNAGVLDVRASLRAARGEHALALADLQEAVRRGGGRVSGGTIPGLMIAVECEHRLGNHAAAREQLNHALDLARDWGTESAIGIVLRTRGRLNPAPAGAIEDLEAAVAHLERSPRRFELAQGLVDLGGALRRAGRRTDARAPLRAGHELARDCAADGLAEQARHELAATGIRLRRERLTGVQSLTASERRIAELAESGASNAEIAQSLFVTVKTVEMHLTHAYRKLDIAGRAGLADVLAPRSRGDRTAA